MTVLPRNLLLLLSLLFPLALAAQPGPAAQPAEAADPEVLQELQQKQQELAVLGRKFDALEQQIRTTEPVQEGMETLREVMMTEMVRHSPEQKEAIERQVHLVEKLTSPESDPDKQEQRMNEYGELRDQLMPVEQQAQQAPAVREAQEEFLGIMIAEMSKIDPEAEDLYERMRSLSQEMQELRARAASSS